MIDGVSNVLTILKAHLSQCSDTPRSLLQLQSLFERPGLILSCLGDICARINTAKSDVELLSKLYGFVQDLEHSTTWLQPMAFQILVHASRPWLKSLGSWIGVEAQLGLGAINPFSIFVQKDLDNKETQELDVGFALGVMPSFITNEDAQLIIETNVGLRLLQTHKPEHPLGRPGALTFVEPPIFEWQFSWQDVERIQARANDYESSLLEVIKMFDMSEYREHESFAETEHLKQNSAGPFGVSPETVQESFGLLLGDMEKPLPEFKSGEDALSETVMGCITLCDPDIKEEAALFAPPLSLVPLISFSPVLSTQARLINKACLRLMFKEHKLRSHFSLQYRYHFFGDGIFASRLTHALFDPELRTAERRKGHSRSGISGVSGLKLGFRDNWPPASSELRLALMGILSDSYYRTRQIAGSPSHPTELPGGLSFAIREMPEEELQRCLDPDAIEAMDFLRLLYKPPPPLGVVITSLSLAKYDAIFKLLLRAQRMTFVVNQLHRGSMGRSPDFHRTVAARFTIEAHHFVASTCGYFFDGVTGDWAIFDQKLGKIERGLEDDDADGAESIQLLRNYHDKILDRIMFALILRKRQEQVMKLLEEIFSSILRFASIMRSDSTDAAKREDKEKRIAEIFETFRKKVRVFVSVCRGLSERRGSGGTKKHGSADDLFTKDDADEDGGNTIGQLLLKLEFSGYYSKPGRW